MIKLHHYKTIVVKIGSALIVDPENYKLRNKWLKNLAKEIKHLKKLGHRIIIVSSGSIICGCKILKQKRQELGLDQLQATAAFGQIFLIEHFKKQFAKQGLKVAQMLITSDDCQNRRRYLNMNDTINKLLEMDIVPIINENDSIVTDEIRFGDNDQLSAQAAQLINADVVIILSDIEGMYDKNPKLYKDAKLISKISNIDDKIISMAKAETNNFGTGGMASKIKAAQIAVNSGSDLIITKGTDKNVILGLEKGKKYSIFKAKNNPISARKQWLSNLTNSATIVIDDGAVHALQNKKSLLPVGVLKYQKSFNRGDIVNICDIKNKVIAKAIIDINNLELDKMIGKNSLQIIKENNAMLRTTVAHCDNIVIL